MVVDDVEWRVEGGGGIAGSDGAAHAVQRLARRLEDSWGTHC